MTTPCTSAQQNPMPFPDLVIACGLIVRFIAALSSESDIQFCDFIVVQLGSEQHIISVFISFECFVIISCAVLLRFILQ